MATCNKNLENLTEQEILQISQRYLMGFHDLIAEGYGFRVKGLNCKRKEYDLKPLTKEMSNDFRIKYIKEHFSDSEIEDTIFQYLLTTRVDEERWRGIYLFDCRFGREYAGLFKQLLGAKRYREIAEQTRKTKLLNTQIERYGGVGLAGTQTKQKAVSTVQTKYGVSNVMHDETCKQRLAITNTRVYGGVSPFSSKDVRQKAQSNRRFRMQNALKKAEHNLQIYEQIFRSRYEAIVYYELVNRFGRDDVYYEYGIHPSDKRYPHNCDFYIRSEDLFIELHAHYSHGNHWFDASNHEDVNRKNQLLLSQSKNSHQAVRVWCDIDLKKRDDAKRSQIKYLVFWDGSTVQVDHQRFPALKDFYKWYDDYNCDYQLFIKHHPENTY